MNIMQTNQLKIALRGLWKNRFYSAISVSGLAVSMACCLFMALYLRNEWTYNTWHHDAGRIFRVVFDNYMGGHQREIRLAEINLT
jgi:putative ABC transport system permease protein